MKNTKTECINYDILYQIDGCRSVEDFRKIIEKQCTIYTNNTGNTVAGWVLTRKNNGFGKTSLSLEAEVPLTSAEIDARDKKIAADNLRRKKRSDAARLAVATRKKKQEQKELEQYKKLKAKYEGAVK